MPIKFANNAVSRLAGAITTSDTTISLLPGDGAKFPALDAGDWFLLTIQKTSGELEIVKAIARSGDVVTIERAKEDTAAAAFSAGDRVDLRLTAGSLLDLLPTGFGPLPWSRANPPSGWIWADGRVLLSDTAYSALRAAYIADSFPFGQDGSGNPKIPDMRGRTAAGLDNMGSGAAGRLTGATLGAGLGAQTHTLTSGEMPVHAHGVNDPTHAHGAWQDGHTHEVSGVATGRASGGYYLSTAGGGFENRIPVFPNSSATNSPTSSGASANGVYVGGAYTGVSIQNTGSGGAHNNVQPTLALHYIVKT